MERFSWPNYAIVSRLQDDFYNFTQGQFAFHSPHRNTPVKFRFVNRTRDVKLASIISQQDLETQFNHFRDLRFTESELNFMAGLKRPLDGKRIFQDDYLDFLARFNLPPYHLARQGDDYDFCVYAPWHKAVYWEVPALQIFTHLYTKGVIEQQSPSQFKQDLIFAAGKINLADKIKMMKDNPDVQVVEFGTRRAANRLWHEYAVTAMKEEVRPEQLLGTSNMYLAMRHGLQPKGTNSHATYQIYSALFPPTLEGLIESQRAFLSDWYEEYGPDLAIFLPDTFTTDFFLNQVMTKKLAEMYKGARQDSGSPYTFAEKQIAMYQRFEINPTHKLVFPSDGLDEEEIPRIRQYVGSRMLCGFGWGSNYSNDLGNAQLGIWAPKNLSTVVKAVEANGRQLVKLSDNSAKAIGDPEEIERIKKLVDYQETRHQPVRY